MKYITWQDSKGYLHQAVVREQDGLEEALQGQGLPADPPDVSLIDWAVVQRELHNALVQHKVLTIEQIQSSNAPLGIICVKALKGELLRLYRQQLEQ